MTIVKCARDECGKLYHVFPSDIKRGFRKHCSQICASINYWNSERGQLEKQRRTLPKKPKQEPKIPKLRYEVQGYISLSGMWNHPLANPKIGVVQEHRFVLWNKLECLVLDCEHECYWCGKKLIWGSASGIIADHLDGNKWNNDPDNLVPACNRCNSHR